MNLYLISQTVNKGCDTYSAAIVAAQTELDARYTYPGNFEWNETYWCKPKDVKIKLIGKALKGTMSGVILASFHAG